MASGFVGQLRFCLRQDVDPSSYGTCTCEEINGFDPNPSDVMLFAKRYMADTSPIRVMCLVPASVCVSLRAVFEQPTGLTPRRGISSKVAQNITSFAPRCVQQGIISQEANAYLQSWVDGTLQQIPRPARYRFLTLRRHDIAAQDSGQYASWTPPRRARVIVVLDLNDLSDSDQDDGNVIMDAE